MCLFGTTVVYMKLLHPPEEELRHTMATSVFRRRLDQDTWHFCTNCSQWPWREFVEQENKPANGEECNECKTRQATQTCR